MTVTSGVRKPFARFARTPVRETGTGRPDPVGTIEREKHR